MIEVGVRELRNGLTRYLRLAEKGQPVLVTRGKRPIAMLHKPDRTSASTEEEILAALVAEGKLLPAANPGPFEPFKPLKLKGKPLSQSVIEDRR